MARLSSVLRGLRAGLAGGLLLALPGCVEFNEQCKGLVENPDQVVAHLGEPVFIDRPNARHANNALGQAAAAAFLDAHSRAGAPAQIGFVNGGAIRAEGYCVTRETLEEGPLTRGTLHEIFQFQNLVIAVDLTEPELVAALEHSVSRLNVTGQTITSPPGGFLHLAGARMQVDCLQTPRVRAAFLEGDGQLLPINLESPDPTRRYRVATTSFLLGGGDGYSMLVIPGRDADRNPLQAETFGGIDANLIAEYMRDTYTEDAPLRTDHMRVELTNCAVPPPPGL